MSLAARNKKGIEPSPAATAFEGTEAGEAPTPQECLFETGVYLALALGAALVVQVIFGFS